MSELKIANEDGVMTFHFAQWDLSCTLSRFKTKSDGTSAEVAIVMPLDGAPKTLTAGVVNLSALVTRDRLVKRFSDLAPLVDWRVVVETICVRGVNEHRRGAPIESLEPCEDDTPTRYLLNPYVYEDHPTLLYGPGESGKSFLALYWACILASGAMENGISTHPDGHGVMYLDWELSGKEMRSRVKMLRLAHPSLKKAPEYRRCLGALAEFAPDLRHEIRARGIGVVVIDSLGSATGGDMTSAEPVLRFFDALASLRCASILISHVAKGTEGREATAYGSVYYYNMARSVYEVKKVQEEESKSYRMALYHRKNNLGRRQHASGFSVTILGDAEQGEEVSASVSAFNPSADATLSAGLPLQVRISQCISDGHNWTVKLLADYLNEDEATIRTILNRFNGERWKRGEEASTGGKSLHATWRKL